MPRQKNCAIDTDDILPLDEKKVQNVGTILRGWELHVRDMEDSMNILDMFLGLNECHPVHPEPPSGCSIFRIEMDELE